MKISIGFSPCPNDTFIFDALVNGKTDNEGLEFEPYLEDIQTLNAWGEERRLDITKLSMPALFPQASYYDVLNAGAALGKGVGPLLVAKKLSDEREVAQSTVAIPGENTTANFLLSYAFPLVRKKVPMLFSSIEDAVCKGEADMGVIIHENRFTYQQKGLHKVCDLGEIWEQREGVPLPLACIAIKNTIPFEVKQKVDRLIRQSVELAFQHYPQLSTYITSHAQAMQEEVMRKHIDLYVNDYSITLGQSGRSAIEKFFAIYTAKTGTGASLLRFV